MPCSRKRPTSPMPIKEEIRSAIQLIITLPNQPEVLHFMCTAWRETQIVPGATEDDFLSENLHNRLLLTAFLQDPTLGRGQITATQEQNLTPFLEAAWAVGYPNQNARKIEAHRKITCMAVGMGLHERLGANCRFRDLEEAVVRMILGSEAE